MVWVITFSNAHCCFNYLKPLIVTGYEVNFHFKMQVNDKKCLLYVPAAGKSYMKLGMEKAWQAFGNCCGGTLGAGEKFSRLITLLFLVCLLCFETISSVLNYL